MRRIVLIALVAALGVATGAVIGFARGRGVQPITALQAGARPAPSATSFGEVEASREPSVATEDPPSQPPQAQGARCDADAMLPVIAASIDPRSDLGRYWASFNIAECQNGYAHGWAITGGPPPPSGTQLEGSEQVFLKDVGGQWTMLSSGTGLDCYPGSMPPDLSEACAALGLP